METEELNRLISTHFIARIIPLIIFGIVIYGCWIFTRVLCIDWLISPDRQHDPRYPEPRHATAIGLIVLYYIILIPFLLSYAILFIKVVWSRDFVDYGPDHESVREKDSRTSDGTFTAEPRHGHGVRRLHTSSSATSSSNAEKEKSAGLELGLGKHHRAAAGAYPRDSAGREAFYMKDVYLCCDDGRPPWCSVCSQFKTDRTHHCKEVNRCVRKMDHFCPWVGGVVAESTFKQFVQFLVYALLYVIVNFAIFVAYTIERHRKLGGYTAHWIVAIGITSFLGLFLVAMIISSLYNVFLNLTTIESIRRKQRNYTLAIYIPPTSKFNTQPHTIDFPKYMCTISFPNAEDPQFAADSMPLLKGETRNFVVVRTKKGETPFDLGSSSANFKELMGYRVYEWFLPWTKSPCQNHSHPEGAYRMGPVVKRLKQEYGLEPGYAPAPVPVTEHRPISAQNTSVTAPTEEFVTPANTPAALPDDEERHLESDLHVEDGSTNVTDESDAFVTPATTPAPVIAQNPAPAPESTICSRSRSRSRSRSQPQRYDPTHQSNRAASNHRHHPHHSHSHHRQGSSAESVPPSVAASGSESYTASGSNGSEHSHTHANLPSRATSRNGHYEHRSRSRSEGRRRERDRSQNRKRMSRSPPTTRPMGLN